MIRTKKPDTSLSTQMKRRVENGVKSKTEYDGNTTKMISTGSTLLDLAISGGRVRGGGLPGGILVEVFGPASAGKTVLLCEIAGAIQRQGGSIMFHDPEARLNKQFARMFDLDTSQINYTVPDTIPEVFSSVRKWKPVGKGINGVMADSLAALSTDMEMENEKGDKMGGRRAKEFSEELRRTCRTLTQNNLLMVCSNQLRQNMNAGPFEAKFVSPGGEAIGFYSSLRLRIMKPQKIKVKQKFEGVEVTRVIGVESDIEVFKSSVWKPYRTASITILFDYGVDDIRQNLQFIKEYSSAATYTLGSESLSKSLEHSIKLIEKNDWQKQLREEVIDLWEEIEKKFESERKPKQR